MRDSRRSILLDILYESVIFAVGKGFPWVEVVKVVKFTEELLKETKGMGHPGLESERLAGGGGMRRIPLQSSTPGALYKARSPFLFTLAFTLLPCMSTGSLSRLS